MPRAWGATPGFPMSGHVRFCFAALLLSGFSISPAFSNPFDALFNSAPAETAAPTPAPAEEECLSQPGKSTADGQHWVYRFDGRRKCWFQVDGKTVTERKPVHRHAVKQHVAARDEDKTALRKQREVADARAELLRSASAEAPQPTPPAPELKMADAAPVITTRAAALVQPAPVVAPATDQLTRDPPAPPHVDVEALLAAAPAASEKVADSATPATSVAVPITAAGEDGRGWTATWLGVLLMSLGLVSLLSSSRSLREAVQVGRFRRLGEQSGGVISER